MNDFEGRRVRLAVVLVVVGLVSLYVLWNVLWTVFFALTFVYVLYPIRRRLVSYGLHPRIAAAVLTTVALAAILALFAPVLVVLYQRRSSIVDFLREVPVTIDVSVAGFAYRYETESLAPLVRDTLSAWAFDVAAAAPVLGMKVFLFIFLVYAILYKPGGVKSTVFRVVDGSVQADLLAYHDRVRDTLYGLYFVQAATGGLTFLIALPVFYVLQYDAYFSLAVIAGILQFVPIIGPSVVVAALAGVSLATGDLEQALLVASLGIVLIGFLPDAILRPRLAEYSAGMPASVYFVGFLGGVLTVGPVGIIAGPLVVALLVETFERLGDHAEIDPAPTDDDTERAGPEEPGADTEREHSEADTGTGDPGADTGSDDPGADTESDDPGADTEGAGTE